MSFKAHFTRFLQSVPDRLHFAAHSHHPWPDVSFEAQQQAWLDAARLMDRKWDKVFGEVIPRAQQHVARLLRLPDPKTVCFAPSVHELFMRLYSAIERRPAHILTTDGEFHSFTRQARRLEEAGLAHVTRVLVEPFETFEQRFGDAVAAGGYDLLYFSQGFYNSGFLIGDLTTLVRAAPDPQALVVIDGYHGFMAVPTDVSGIAARAFYVAGGYKYAMSGEGVCFMHCPPGYAPRPVDTGWFAGFAALSAPQDGRVSYAADGSRFLGATYDPTGLYRFNTVMDFMQQQNLSVPAIRAHVLKLQQAFLERIGTLNDPVAEAGNLIPPSACARGNFLCFRHPQAGAKHEALANHNVVTDYRDDRLRIGFGIYHDPDDIEALCRRLA